MKSNDRLSYPITFATSKIDVLDCLNQGSFFVIGETIDSLSGHLKQPIDEYAGYDVSRRNKV